MRRSRQVHLVLVSGLGPLVAALLAGCAEQAPQPMHCVDQSQVVVRDELCNQPQGGGLGYSWWYGGSRYYGLGTRLSEGSRVASESGSYRSSSGITRGGFGGGIRGGIGGGSSFSGGGRGGSGE